MPPSPPSFPPYPIHLAPIAREGTEVHQGNRGGQMGRHIAASDPRPRCTNNPPGIHGKMEPRTDFTNLRAEVQRCPRLPSPPAASLPAPESMTETGQGHGAPHEDAKGRGERQPADPCRSRCGPRGAGVPQEKILVMFLPLGQMALRT